MQIAEAVKIVLKSSQPYISIVLDKERIKALQMEASFDSIKHSIANDKKLKKLKLKPEVRIPLSDLCFLLLFPWSVYV